MKILITERQFEGLLVLLEEKNQKIIDKLVNFGLIEKSTFSIKKSWEPVFNENKFNEILNKYLDDYMVELKNTKS